MAKLQSGRNEILKIAPIAPILILTETRKGGAPSPSPAKGLQGRFAPNLAYAKAALARAAPSR